MDSVLEILRKTEAWFHSKDVPRARLDAEHLIAHVLGCARLDLYLRYDMPLTEDALRRLRPMVRQRARRVPLQHIIGNWDFHNIVLKVDERALIPRPETEQLVDETIAMFGEHAPMRILDLGTGSGAIVLALLKQWPNACAIAIDQSASALALAAENALANQLIDRLELREGNWFRGVATEDRFDLIIANPPYLSASEWEIAEPEVRDHDPRNALVASENGLADLRHILVHARSYLEPGALLCLETGTDHHSALATLAANHGYETWRSKNDYHGRPRFFFATK